MNGSPQVAGVILHRDGRVLLQHRDDNPAIRYPGFWGFFGGHVEPGETPEEAAVREIQEELGLHLMRPLELVHHHDDGDRDRFIYVAELTVDPEDLSLGEGQGLALLGLEELHVLPVVPAHLQIILAWLEVSA